MFTPVLQLPQDNQTLHFLRSWQLGGECPHDNIPIPVDEQLYRAQSEPHLNTVVTKAECP